MTPRPYQEILRHRPLKSDQTEIRLLEVYPANSINEPIRGRLFNVALTDELNYIGLSLLHGDVSNTELIYINGQPLHVPNTIGQALRNMRTIFTPDKVLDDLFSGPKALCLDRQSTTSTRKSNPQQPSTSIDTASSRTSANVASSSGSSKPPRSIESNTASKAATWLKNTFRIVRFKRPGRLDPGSQKTTQSLQIWLDALCINDQDANETNRRRSYTALAYRNARLVVGWVGPEDEDSAVAVKFMTTLADAAPIRFGEAKHRKEHPEHYGPIMEFMAPLKSSWDLAPGQRAVDHPTHMALKSFLGRPYFCNNWILEELAFSRFPAFLVGGMLVSWLQILRFICIAEEVMEKGSAYFPDENRPVLNFVPLASVYIFLEEYDRRQAQFELEGKD